MSGGLMGLLDAVDRYERGELTADEFAAHTRRVANRMIEQARSLARAQAEESVDRALHGDACDMADAILAKMKSGSQRRAPKLRLLRGGKP